MTTALDAEESDESRNDMLGNMNLLMEKEDQSSPNRRNVATYHEIVGKKSVAADNRLLEAHKQIETKIKDRQRQLACILQRAKEAIDEKFLEIDAKLDEAIKLERNGRKELLKLAYADRVQRNLSLRKILNLQEGEPMEAGGSDEYDAEELEKELDSNRASHTQLVKKQIQQRLDGIRLKAQTALDEHHKKVERKISNFLTVVPAVHTRVSRNLFGEMERMTRQLIVNYFRCRQNQKAEIEKEYSSIMQTIRRFQARVCNRNDS